ncbi:MAG: translation initiation factor IF-2, partial [Clostridia bacterium]|nr:translation initiation factor IF-2 [Clostridia bacterium]
PGGGPPRAGGEAGRGGRGGAVGRGAALRGVPVPPVTRPDAATGRHDGRRSRGRASEERWALRERDEVLRPAPVRKQTARFQVAREITLKGPLLVGELASLLHVPSGEVIKTLLRLGGMATINDTLDVDTATLVAEELGATVKVELPEEQPTDEELLARALEGEDREKLQPRPPVVTVMGHVDHGKTTLLDAIRNTRVAAEEAGGITQHIGASVVELDGRRIVFLDTPGHEAFTAMRARGARVTDIAVLVVAADDGVMPQTVEAINHARAAGVPIVVALNKVDRADANPDRVKQQLAEHGLVPEEWGGDTVIVPVSALRREGLDRLLEMILLVADMQDLRANPDRPAIGTVIEAKLDRGRGPVATVLVQHGTLRQGDAFVAGVCYGRVRAMIDHAGQAIREAGPSTPAEVLGFSDVPLAGDVFRVVEDERVARQLAEARQTERRAEELSTRRAVSLTDFYRRMQAGEEKELRLILKADVQGSLEAVQAALEKLRSPEAHVTVLHAAVGGISESDVMLASASEAVVVGFNVRPDGKARALAQETGVEVKTYRIIYELVDDIRAALSGLLSPKLEEVVVGRAETRATFRVPDIGTVAGLYVTEGKVVRGGMARVIRDGVVVHEGPVASLKRFKDDVREVSAGYECGMTIERFQDIKIGDVIEVYQQRQVAREFQPEET